MNGQQPYDYLKDALKHFGLRFSEMDQVEVTFQEGVLVFYNRGVSITINVEETL